MSAKLPEAQSASASAEGPQHAPPRPSSGFGEALFPCVECGGSVRMASAEGLTWQLCKPSEGPPVPIPAHVLVPRCDRCGDAWYGPEDSARVDAALREAGHGAPFVDLRAEWEAAAVGFGDSALGFSEVRRAEFEAMVSRMDPVESSVLAVPDSPPHTPQSLLDFAARGFVRVNRYRAMHRRAQRAESKLQRIARDDGRYQWLTSRLRNAERLRSSPAHGDVAPHDYAAVQLALGLLRGLQRWLYDKRKSDLVYVLRLEIGSWTQ